MSLDYDLPALNLSVYELTVDVSIVVNELAQDDKTFSVEVSLISPFSRVIIVPTSAQVTIVDDSGKLSPSPMQFNNLHTLIILSSLASSPNLILI